MTEVSTNTGAVLASGNQPGQSASNGSNAPPQTAKEWYYFWKQSGDQINSNSNLVTQGSHASRPNPANTPNGALYSETDRGGVIYQLRNGQWWYVAGVMYGPLNPDTRPTDLGVTDGGFEFHSSDAVAPYKDRQFIWSQTAWIETTPVRYGTQAERLAVVLSDVIDQLLWVETDTGDIYQLQSGSWVQVGGSGGGGGGAVSSVFGRTGAVAANAGDYSAWMVTNAVDSTAAYANPAWLTSLAWSKLTGVPATGVSSVFGRTGAVVAASGDYTAAQVTNAVSTAATYANPAWLTSLAWTKITGAPTVPQAGDAQIGIATANLTLTMSVQDIAGTQLTLARAGRYLIWGVIDFILAGADAGYTFIGTLVVNGATASNQVLFNPQYVSGAPGGNRATVAQQWFYSLASAGAVVKLQAYKTGGTGTSFAGVTNTTLSAIWISP